MRKHLESYYYAVDLQDPDWRDSPKCEKAFRRFISDKLASYFPISCADMTTNKIYKIDCDKIFGVENPDAMKKVLEKCLLSSYADISELKNEIRASLGRGQEDDCKIFGVENESN